MRTVIACLRVSTDKQGESGLGIEAQRTAISRFVEAKGLELIGEHVEVETGKGPMPLAAARCFVTRWHTPGWPRPRWWWWRSSTH